MLESSSSLGFNLTAADGTVLENGRKSDPSGGTGGSGHREDSGS